MVPTPLARLSVGVHCSGGPPRQSRPLLESQDSSRILKSRCQLVQWKQQSPGCHWVLPSRGRLHLQKKQLLVSSIIPSSTRRDLPPLTLAPNECWRSPSYEGWRRREPRTHRAGEVSTSRSSPLPGRWPATALSTFSFLWIFSPFLESQHLETAARPLPTCSLQRTRLFVLALSKEAQHADWTARCNKTEGGSRSCQILEVSFKSSLNSERQIGSGHHRENQGRQLGFRTPWRGLKKQTEEGSQLKRDC